MTLLVVAFLAGMIFALACICAWALAAANTVTDREARACPVCGGEMHPLVTMADEETRPANPWAAMAQDASWAHFDPDEHRLLFDHCAGRVRREPHRGPMP